MEIKGLQLINIAIANYMSPSMILLIDDISDSIITLLGPLITTKLTHDDCNVKQSALEVVQTITFNSNKSKYNFFFRLITIINVFFFRFSLVQRNRFERKLSEFSFSYGDTNFKNSSTNHSFQMFTRIGQR